LRQLNWDKWFTEGPNGNLKLKRVSASDELQFPKKYRTLVKESGLVSLINHLKKENKITLSEAWKKCKNMFGKPVRSKLTR